MRNLLSEEYSDLTPQPSLPLPTLKSACLGTGYQDQLL